jgi:alcohol dehydrogenase (cytochrome c)
LGKGDLNTGGPARFGGSILAVNGVLYVTSPDNVWAVDARSGNIMWHYYWKTRGGTHTGNRGVGMWHNYLYLEVHDDMLVSLDATTGKERWHKEISNFDAQYFSSMAPMIIGNHVLVGTGNDEDAPGFIQSFDPETGERQWITYTVPMKKGDPGADTWANLDRASHGGAQVWIPGAYDPDSNLYIFGTGNPTPAYTQGRGEGDNLYTCSLVALNPDTGKIVWHYQTSPHDSHDWDSTQTPAIADITFQGKPRKVVMQATRNGYFFMLDRVTGEHLVTGKLGTVNNWAKGLDDQGRPMRNPEKDATIPGSIVSSEVTNYPPPTYSLDTGLFYFEENNSLRISYLIDPDPRGSMGLGGTLGGPGFNYGSNITAIDPTTGKPVWKHEIAGSSPGLLSTAGKLVFSGDGSYLIALDSTNGKTLWHTKIGAASNGPETFLLDGKQYLLASGGGSLYCFVLN